LITVDPNNMIKQNNFRVNFDYKNKIIKIFKIFINKILFYYFQKPNRNNFDQIQYQNTNQIQIQQTRNVNNNMNMNMNQVQKHQITTIEENESSTIDELAGTIYQVILGKYPKYIIHLYIYTFELINFFLI